MSEQYEDLGVTTDLDVISRFLDVKGKFIVDAGCGNMNLSRALAEKGAHVLAIDPDAIQAEKNRQAQTTPNVGFAECGAEAIPVENNSVDGVVFPYSFHHIPARLYPQVFDELFRVLKPSGFVYAMEPVASGDLNKIMRLFHDEAKVRAEAQTALGKLANSFEQVSLITYRIALEYQSWEEFASRYANKSFNANYTEADVRAPAVKEMFLAVGESRQFKFESPMQVTFLQGVSNLPGVSAEQLS